MKNANSLSTLTLCFSFILSISLAATDSAEPVVVYSTYYGGSGTDDCDTITVDHLGNAYLGCHLTSLDLPGSNEYEYTISGGMDAFVIKLNQDADEVNYISQLGGSEWDAVQGITTDIEGNIYAVGSTYSADFPTSVDAAQTKFGGKSDAFVAKIDPSGEILWATYLGGSEDEDGRDIFLDVNGNLQVVGRTASTDFQTSTGSAQPVNGGGTDAFIASFDTQGHLIYSTYLGGSGDDIGFAIVADDDGRRYLSGTTNSSDFPVYNALYSSPFGNEDAFFAVLDSEGSSFELASYLGGSGTDRGYGIEIDPFGNVIIMGHTTSSDLSTTQNAAQINFGGSSDAFVAKIDIVEQQLLYLTYLGGSDEDRPRTLVVDQAGRAIIVGQTSSLDFPLSPSERRGLSDADDGFVAILDASGSTLSYSFVIGGLSIDAFEGAAINSDGSLTIVGLSNSLDFPTVAPLQAAFAGGRFDIVIARLLIDGSE